eukprot:16437239-Heterocapsa_arctica.AAC.1
MFRGASYTFGGYRWLPAVTDAYRRLPAVLAAPLIRILNRAAGLSNKSKICNGCKHLLSKARA